MKILNVLALMSTLAAIPAMAADYELTVTNGGPMPISGSVIYVLNGVEPLNAVGETPTPGFVALCEKGDAAARLTELRNDTRVASAQRFADHLAPGARATFLVSLDDPATQTVHFETMYGKTQEVCGVIHANASLAHSGTDVVVESGAYAPITVPAMGLKAACANAAGAVPCLRALAPRQGTPKVRAFAGYLPRVLSSLEEKYGADEVQSLLVPSGGFLHYSLKRR